MSSEEKEMAQKPSAKTITGIEYSNMRRRPILSMNANARRVKRKLVTATVRDVNVGDEKESALKMIPEKYIKLSNPHSC